MNLQVYNHFYMYTRLQTVWSLPGQSRQANKDHNPAVTVAPTTLVGSLIRSFNLPHSLQGAVHNDLTRAPLGYFYNAPHWGVISSPPPLISETTGPILKIQAAFESPGKTVKGK